jgi:hypothetical protein
MGFRLNCNYGSACDRSRTSLPTDYSRTVAHYIAQTIRQDEQWRKIFTIESKRYVKLAGYRNLQPYEDNYKVRLNS